MDTPYNAFGNPEPSNEIATGFNPLSLTNADVGAEYGWHLLNEGDTMRPGDGFWHPDSHGRWLCYENRPDVLRDNVVKQYPVRRRNDGPAHPCMVPPAFTVSVEHNLPLTDDQRLIIAALEKLATLCCWTVAKSPRKDTMTVSFVPPEERK